MTFLAYLNKYVGFEALTMVTAVTTQYHLGCDIMVSRNITARLLLNTSAMCFGEHCTPQKHLHHTQNQCNIDDLWRNIAITGFHTLYSTQSKENPLLLKTHFKYLFFNPYNKTHASNTCEAFHLKSLSSSKDGHH
jgi:hypothetical protein